MKLAHFVLFFSGLCALVHTPRVPNDVLALSFAVPAVPLLFFVFVRPCCATKISEEHREKFRFDKFIVVAPCDDAGGAGPGQAMLSDFYFSRFDDEVLLQVRGDVCVLRFQFLRGFVFFRSACHVNACDQTDIGCCT